MVERPRKEEKKKKARVFILTDSRLLCVQEIQCL